MCKLKFAKKFRNSRPNHRRKKVKLKEFKNLNENWNKWAKNKSAEPINEMPLNQPIDGAGGGGGSNPDLVTVTKQQLDAASDKDIELEKELKDLTSVAAYVYKKVALSASRLPGDAAELIYPIIDKYTKNKGLVGGQEGAEYVVNGFKAVYNAATKSKNGAIRDLTSYLEEGSVKLNKVKIGALLAAAIPAYARRVQVTVAMFGSKHWDDPGDMSALRKAADWPRPIRDRGSALRAYKELARQGKEWKGEKMTLARADKLATVTGRRNISYDKFLADKGYRKVAKVDRIKQLLSKYFKTWKAKVENEKIIDRFINQRTAREKADDEAGFDAEFSTASAGKAGKKPPKAAKAAAAAAAPQAKPSTTQSPSKPRKAARKAPASRPKGRNLSDYPQADQKTAQLVKQLQQRLAQIGLLPSEDIDSVFGSQTAGAIRRAYRTGGNQ